MAGQNRSSRISTLLTELQSNALKPDDQKRISQDVQTKATSLINDLRVTLELLAKANPARFVKALELQIDMLGVKPNLSGYSDFTVTEAVTTMEPQPDFPDRWIASKKADLRPLVRSGNLTEAFIQVATTLSKLAAECDRRDRAFNKYGGALDETRPVDEKTCKWALRAARTALTKVKLLAAQGHFDENTTTMLTKALSDVIWRQLLKIDKVPKFDLTHAPMLSGALLKLHLSCGFGNQRGARSKDAAAHYVVAFAALRGIRLQWHSVRNISMSA